MRRTLLLCLVAASLAAVAGTTAGRWMRPAAPESNPEPMSPLGVDPTRLDFGEVWEDQHFEWALPLTNLTESPITVTGVSGSCSCTSVAPSSFVLGSREQTDLRVGIDLSPKPTELGLQIRTFSVRIDVDFRTETGVVGHSHWVVTGRVKRALQLPSEIYLGSHSEGGQPIPPVSLHVDARVPIESVIATASAPFLRVTTSAPAWPATRFDLTVAVTDRNLPEGSFETWATVEAVAVGGVRLPAARVTISGGIVPDIRTEPPQIVFGGRLVGEQYETDLTVRSLTGKPITIETVSPDGEGLRAARSPSDPSSVRVTQRVAAAGQLETAVRLVVRAGGKVYRFRIPVLGFGVAGRSLPGAGT